MSALDVVQSSEPTPAKPKRRRSQKYPGIPTVAVPPDDELGPCMLVLTPLRRRFVLELAHGPSGYGSDLRAGRAAGFGGDDATVRMQVSRALHNQKVQDALREVGGKLIRASAFNAIRQTERIANDMKHRDCLKACLALMDRGGFAVETHHTVTVVTVEHKSLDDQALEALRTMRTLRAVTYGHDGNIRSKESGRTTAELYRKEGLRMLATHATFAKGGFDFEAGIAEMATRFRDGRLKVARHLQDWFQEYRAYHRDEKGLVHKLHDDLMSATRMLCMQIRSAKEFDDHRPGFHAGEPYRRQQDAHTRFAIGSANHPDGPYDIFTGRPMNGGATHDRQGRPIGRRDYDIFNP